MGEGGRAGKGPCPWHFMGLFGQIWFTREHQTERDNDKS